MTQAKSQNEHAEARLPPPGLRTSALERAPGGCQFNKRGAHGRRPGRPPLHPVRLQVCAVKGQLTEPITRLAARRPRPSFSRGCEEARGIWHGDRVTLLRGLRRVRLASASLHPRACTSAPRRTISTPCRFSLGFPRCSVCLRVSSFIPLSPAVALCLLVCCTGTGHAVALAHASHARAERRNTGRCRRKQLLCRHHLLPLRWPVRTWR